MLSNCCYGNHTKDFFINLLFSETLKRISNILQNLTFVQLSVDEIVRGPDTWYKVWVQNSLVYGRVKIQKCLFKENKATYSGGATHIKRSKLYF